MNCLSSCVWTYQRSHVEPSQVLNNPFFPGDEWHFLFQEDAPEDEAPDEDDGRERDDGVEPDLTNQWDSELHPDVLVLKRFQEQHDRKCA